MNTGLQDAANLGWKLAAVVKGEASAAKLLPTYEAERRPVAQWVLSTTDKTFAGITTASSPALAVARNWLIKTHSLARESLGLAPRNGAGETRKFDTKMRSQRLALGQRHADTLAEGHSSLSPLLTLHR